MSANNKFPDTLGANFFCLDEPPDPNCPALAGEWITEAGIVSCRSCLHRIGMLTYDDQPDLFDEDEDYDGGPIGMDTLPTAEGDRIQDRTPDMDKRLYREDTIIEMSEEIYKTDPDLALFLSNNQREIIDLLRRLEQSDHPLFRGREEKEKRAFIGPKVIAVASHLRNIPPSRTTLVKNKISPSTTLNMYKVINTMLSPYKDARIEMTFMSAGKMMGMPESLIKSALEEYEADPPLISETNRYAIVVAWLKLMADKYDFPITQAKAISLTQSPRNATRRALKELSEFIRNLKVSKETPTPHALTEEGNME